MHGIDNRKINCLFDFRREIFQTSTDVLNEFGTKTLVKKRDEELGGQGDVTSVALWIWEVRSTRRNSALTVRSRWIRMHSNTNKWSIHTYHDHVYPTKSWKKKKKIWSDCKDKYIQWRNNQILIDIRINTLHSLSSTSAESEVTSVRF